MLTTIESPFKPSNKLIARYAGTYTEEDLIRQNLAYARTLLGDSLGRGESPFMSHLLYTQAWAETDILRGKGIAAGLKYLKAAELVVYGIDLGWSPGMLWSLNEASLCGLSKEERTLYPDLTQDQLRVLLHKEPRKPFVMLRGMEVKS